MQRVVAAGARTPRDSIVSSALTFSNWMLALKGAFGLWYYFQSVSPETAAILGSTSTTGRYHG